MTRRGGRTGREPVSRAVPGSKPPAWLRDALERAGIQPRPDLGQHFLTDPQLLDRQVAYAALGAEHTVLEIGAGIGQLTTRLAACCRRVIAIEKDERFRPLLEELAGSHGNIELIWGDALQVDLPPVDTMVANLPYGPALPLTFRLLEQRFQRAVLMYQLRLAQRLCAHADEPYYGRLSVAAARLADAEILEVVGPAAFHPPPAVESALVLLYRRKPRFSVPEEDFFRSVLVALFARRDMALDEAMAVLGKVPAGSEAETDGESRRRGRGRVQAGKGRRRPAKRPGYKARRRRGDTHSGECSSSRGRGPYTVLPGLASRKIQLALCNLDGKLRRKPVFRLTPRQFGQVTWALWHAAHE